MPVKAEEKKTIELWPGEEVEVSRIELLRDLDYIRDVQKQLKDNDLSVIDTLFALVGGEETLNKLRSHIIEEKGVFDIDEVSKVTKQLLELFPKASSSSSKRW